MVEAIKAERTREQLIADELQAIYKKRGKLITEDVVTFARDKTTTLYSEFDWNDTRAAHRHRLDTAARIIRAHVTILTPKANPVRAWVSLRSDRAQNNGYRPMRQVMASKRMRKELLDQAKADADAFQKRYETLCELVPVFDAMHKVFD